MSQSLTQGLANFVAAPGFNAVPGDILPTIRNGFIDTLACLLSGREETVTLAALRVAGHRGNLPESSVLLGHGRLCAIDAAFVNGVSSHALDYDDMALNGHPSVVLVPALLAAGEACRARDQVLLRAYLVGYEVWAELIGREPDSLHNKGWHPTCVTGTIAVAAAVAHLENLPATQAGHALGIAASLASGLMGNFGSMTKPLHAGWAASHGIEAVRLARAGVTASANILEADTGFLAAFSPRGKVERGSWSPPEDLRFRHNGLSVKKYPVCYAAHRIIDGIIALKQARSFDASQVKAIRPSLSETTARVLHVHQPTTALQAKFSLEFACAMAICEAAVGLPQVTDAQLARADIQALFEKVHIETVPASCPIEPDFAMHDRVRIELNDGSMLDSGPIRFARGHKMLPLSDADIQIKFMGCVRQAEQPAAATLLTRLSALGTLEDGSLCDDLRKLAFTGQGGWVT